MNASFYAFYQYSGRRIVWMSRGPKKKEEKKIRTNRWTYYTSRWCLLYLLSMQATRNCDVYFRLHWQNVPAPTISPHTRLGRPFCHYHRNVRRDVITDYSELSDSPLRALVPHPSVITVFLSNSLTKHFDYCFPVWHSNKKQKNSFLCLTLWKKNQKKTPS